MTKRQKDKNDKRQKDKKTKTEAETKAKTKRHKDTKTQRQKDKKTKRQKDKKTKRQKDKKTKRQNGKMTKRQKDTKTQRQNDKKTKRQNGKKTQRQNDKNTAQQRIPVLNIGHGVCGPVFHLLPAFNEEVYGDGGNDFVGGNLAPHIGHKDSVAHFLLPNHNVDMNITCNGPIIYMRMQRTHHTLDTMDRSYTLYNGPIIHSIQWTHHTL
jgi:hypothetical protein